MIIDRPPPPAAKDCKICVFSTQIIPLILGNDLESMATEPMYVSYVKYKDQSSWEMKSGKEGGGGRGARREQMRVEEKSAHLDAFVITTVSFLWVQIYKTDLRVKKKRASGWRDFTVILKFLHCLSISYTTEAVCSGHHIVILTEAFLRRCSCLRGAGRSRCKPEMIFFPHVSSFAFPLQLSPRFHSVPVIVPVFHSLPVSRSLGSDCRFNVMEFSCQYWDPGTVQ